MATLEYLTTGEAKIARRLISETDMLHHLANLSRNQARSAKTDFLRKLSENEANKWESRANAAKSGLTYAEWKKEMDKKHGVF